MLLASFCRLPGARIARSIQLRPVDRELLHLTAIDVAAQRGGGGVHERRVAGDGHRFLNLRRRHLELQRGRLSDEQLDSPDERGETGQFQSDLIAPGIARAAGTPRARRSHRETCCPRIHAAP